MDEFEDADAEINAPLDIRFVIVGLLIMISSLFMLALAQNVFIKSVCGLCFLASIFMMIKKAN